MGTARRRSKVETELPRELREEANRLILEGVTYDDLAAWSREKGFEISRSAWGRYGKEYYASYQAIRQFEDQSRALAGEAGEGLTMDEALTKMLQQRVAAALMRGEWDVMEVPRLLADVAKLQASNISREKLKADFADRAKAAADRVEKILAQGARTIARTGGLTDRTIQIIRREILGIAKQ